MGRPDVLHEIGLPGVDFNHLEYAEPITAPGTGKRKLKCVHTWNWPNWPMFQRYHIEGSVLKGSSHKRAFSSQATSKSGCAGTASPRSGRAQTA